VSPDNNYYNGYRYYSGITRHLLLVLATGAYIPPSNLCPWRLRPMKIYATYENICKHFLLMIRIVTKVYTCTSDTPPSSFILAY